MTEEEYLTMQSQLFTLASLVRGLPLEEFLLRINHAETIGPILDPTLYLQAGDKLAKIKRLAEGLHDFQRAVLEVEP
jgi:hypothetical protein